MTRRPPWRPIADGPLRVRAERALREIAGAIAPPLRAWTPRSASRAGREAAGVSLAAGASGFAVLHSYLARARRSSGHAERARTWMQAAAGAVPRLDLDASLFAGFTGVAWAMEHVARRLGDRGGEDPLEGIDEALRSLLARRGGPALFDLVSGLVGIGVYASERLPRPAAADLFRRVIARLWERRERVPGGIAWRTPGDALAASPWPLGPYDLGLAHGVPGVIALLGIACAQGVETDRARILLQGAVARLLERRLPADRAAAYPHSAGHGSDGAPSRLAWCYGDLGIASALLLAARGAGVAAWEEEAVALGKRAAARDPSTSGVHDAALCHGAAGVAHLFNRLYHSTRVGAFAEAAREWLGRALDYRTPGRGAAGFRAWTTKPGRRGTWVSDPGLLSGSTGIGLALLAALEPIEPEWDRMLLLSARAHRA